MAYNDYNPIINNTVEPQAGLTNYAGIRKSREFMDADYSPSSTNPLIPINKEQLLVGSASKAAVQDSYYASKFWSTSRYFGNRVSSQILMYQ